VPGVEVHAKAAEVLAFWFDEMKPEQHFAKSDAIDRSIRERFGPLRDLVLGSGAAGWRDNPDTLLAAILLLDQFSRNMHRGKAEAFAGDTLAQELTRLAIDRGWDAGMPPERRGFLYMPLMHAEDVDAQRRNVELCEALHREAPPDLEAELAKQLKYAKLHAQIIDRFGRFPHRNAVLGRESTAEEKTYLEEQGSSF